MRRLPLVARLTFAALALVAGAGLTACKSGEGERCQVKADCAAGLECATSTHTCVDSVIGETDAQIDAPIDARSDATEADAPEADASPIDASPLDAPLDAAIDAI